MASQASNLWVLLGLGIAGILLTAKKLKETIREDFGTFADKLLLRPPPQPAPPSAAACSSLCRSLLLPLPQPAPPKAPHPLTGFSFAVSDGINGENKHYESPTNPAAHDRIDTVGGVRVPAGYYGVLGFKSSYGAISNTWIIPVSSSLDSVGWFARTPYLVLAMYSCTFHFPHNGVQGKS